MEIAANAGVGMLGRVVIFPSSFRIAVDGHWRGQLLSSISPSCRGAGREQLLMAGLYR
jgi:hypothetical protein